MIQQYLIDFDKSCFVIDVMLFVLQFTQKAENVDRFKNYVFLF